MRSPTYAYSNRLYRIWVGMRQRCSNPKTDFYDRYGGRGITVCQEWDSFREFQSWALGCGYNDSLTIERQNSTGHYCPSNCYWADQFVQQANKEKRPGTKHQYIGVREIHGGRWRAVINAQRQQISLGCFDTETAAVAARDAYIKANNLPHKTNL